MGHRTKAELKTDKAPGAPRVEAPDPDPQWHRIARMYWDAFHTSGQVQFWEPSDWAMAYDVCEEISRHKESGRRSAQMRSAIDSALARLAVSDGDRRRLRIELTRGGGDEEEPAAPVAVMDEYRDLYG